MDLSRLNPNYLSALLSSDPLPPYPMPVAPPVAAADPKPRKPRSDKGVPKAKPGAGTAVPATGQQAATPRKRKPAPTPTAPSPDAPQPKKPRVRKPKAPEADAEEKVVGEKKKRVRKPKADVKAEDADPPPTTPKARAKKEPEKKEPLQISAKEVRLKGMNNNALDKIPSVNAPPADAAANVPLPGYPTLGSIFAEVYSAHRTVDNRLTGFGKELAQFIAAQHETNQEIRREWEQAKRDRQEEQLQQTQIPQSPTSYDDVDNVPSIIPVTP